MMLRIFVLFFCALLPCPPAMAQETASQAFFQRLKALDGKRFAGSMVFPTDKPDHEMNKPMIIHFQLKSPNEIHVPFRVGDNTSRTWILHGTRAGLLLKHDHRLPDGSPDPITLYGGWALPGGVGGAQMFPADDATSRMLPAAATNCWMLWLSPDGKTLSYYLERNFEPRFQADFDLSKPLP